MSEQESSEVLIERLKLIGDGVVPKSAFEDLNNGEFWIFLTEPDPNKWPPQMQGLKKYLQE